MITFSLTQNYQIFLLVALQLDEAAPVLAGLNEPIVLAKVNADKLTRLASKYDIE